MKNETPDNKIDLSTFANKEALMKKSIEYQRELKNGEGKILFFYNNLSCLKLSRSSFKSLKFCIFILLSCFCVQANQTDLTQEQLNKRLISAVKENNIEEARRLIREGAKVNDENYTYTRGYWPPLFYAESTEMTQFMLDEGADAKATGPLGHNALHFAGRKPAGVARALIQAGTDVNAYVKGLDIQDGVIIGAETDPTPLHRANKNLAVSRLLVEAGADVNAQGTEFMEPTGFAPPGQPNPPWRFRHGRTPLGGASPEVADFLLSVGASWDGNPGDKGGAKKTTVCRYTSDSKPVQVKPACGKNICFAEVLCDVSYLLNDLIIATHIHSHQETPAPELSEMQKIPKTISFKGDQAFLAACSAMGNGECPPATECAVDDSTSFASEENAEALTEVLKTSSKKVPAGVQ